MKYTELKELPNDGFKIAASMYGVLDNKFIIGGGSGFIKPLAEGGPKLLSNTIRLLSENNGEWIVHQEVKVFKDGLPYKFCNGASIVYDNKLYYFAGLKIEDEGSIVPSADIIEVEIINGKINWKIYRDILPFQGETTGTLFENKFILICGNTSYEVSFEDPNFTCKKNAFDTEDDVNGTLVSTTENGYLYLIGGYKPFEANNPDSNKFLETKISRFTGFSFETRELKNLTNESCVFFGGSCLPYDKNHILVIGGVNKEKFIDAIYNLSVLKDEALKTFKDHYFNMSEEEFGFNKKLLLVDVVTKKVISIGTFPHGFAGNPAFVKLNNTYYILNSEIKAGVRLENPIKFTLGD